MSDTHLGRFIRFLSVPAAVYALSLLAMMRIMSPVGAVEWVVCAGAAIVLSALVSLVGLVLHEVWEITR